ncbi:MAG: M64 family metallo-endopeptidase [Salinivirgaceae bacterium]|jgi:hypothetical protein|nr:M64 family metallo-endopeptidase [Salinivirgaceae bacterium]
MSYIRSITFLLFLFIISGSTSAQPTTVLSNAEWLRIDFMLSGFAHNQQAAIVQLKKEPHFSIENDQFVWPFDYGTYVIEVIDENDNLVFKRGFSTLYEEWLITDLVSQGTYAFEQTVRIPFPLQNVKVLLKRRVKTNFELMNQWNISPNNTNVVSYVERGNIITELISGDGNKHNRLDLAFVADGYTIEEKQQAMEDVKRFADFLLTQAPFQEYSERINIRLVFEPSEMSGVTEPTKHKFLNTAVSSSFNTLNLKRYLCVERYFKLMDVAAAVPYDFVLVMVNTDRYGGGGFFNHVSVFSARGRYSETVFLHEFGHHFGGLADEYFDSEVPYLDGMDTTYEHWKPNVTALVDFSAKWDSLVNSSTPVPTPRTAKYRNVTGAFEGGAYMTKGVYSPAMNCRMRSNQTSTFCAACDRSLAQMLKFYTK